MRHIFSCSLGDNYVMPALKLIINYIKEAKRKREREYLEAQYVLLNIRSER